MNMKTKRSEDLLREASEHLYYEIWMLNRTAPIGCKRDSEVNTVINNCIVESFGIHARNLRDFFFNTSGKKDDILAVDFFDDPEEWSKYINRKSDILNEINKRVGKELVHLTYTRIGKTPEEKIWQKGEIARDINRLFKDFLKRVPKERICERLILFERRIP